MFTCKFTIYYILINGVFPIIKFNKLFPVYYIYISMN